MAMELYSESSSTAMSPRISFSHDLSQADVVPIEQSNSSSTLDFDFCIFHERFDHESSSADELFSGGKILPTKIKQKQSSVNKSEPPPLPPPPPPRNDDLNPDFVPFQRLGSKNDSPAEKIGANSESNGQKPDSKSFWRFKRSASLNCGSSYGRSLCPIPLLARSNSTGSTPNVKRSSAILKDNVGAKPQKSPAGGSIRQSQPGAHHQKPPLKKTYGSYGNGVNKITPVLNVPTPNIFGFSSIFSSSKDKSKKR